MSLRKEINKIIREEILPKKEDKYDFLDGMLLKMMVEDDNDLEPETVTGYCGELLDHFDPVEFMEPIEKMYKIAYNKIKEKNLSMER